jgi:hypothetical protein
LRFTFSYNTLMQFRLRTLLIAFAIALTGCSGRTASKIETIRRGVDDVERHAKEIEDASEPNR